MRAALCAPAARRRELDPRGSGRRWLDRQEPLRDARRQSPHVAQKKVIPWSHESVAAVIDALPMRYRAIGVVASAG